MVFFVFQLLAMALVAYFGWGQIISPMLKEKPLFPMLRENDRRKEVIKTEIYEAKEEFEISELLEELDNQRNTNNNSQESE